MWRAAYAESNQLLSLTGSAKQFGWFQARDRPLVQIQIL